jgi:hypothetical protein
LKSAVIVLSILLGLPWLNSCSSYNAPSQTTTQTSKIKPRAFVSNSVANRLQIVDAGKDQLSLRFTVSVDSQPGLMVLASNKLFTLVFNAGSNTVNVVNNAQETSTATLGVQAFTESIVISPDSNSAYAALPGAVTLGQPSGVLQVLDLVNNRTSAKLPIPEVRRVVINHAGNRLLAFSDNSDSVTMIDPTKIGISPPLTVLPGFNRPVSAVFSDDDSTAYVLNCGGECGGTSASVTPLNMSSNQLGPAIPVSGATTGALTNGNLYVAGSASGGGTLQVINTAALTASAPVNIGNGFHDQMKLASNNKLFVGARQCTTGCLSIFDISTQAAVIDPSVGDVTGMEPIADRNVVYVCEGGELRIFDTTTSAPSSTAFIDIVGQAIDVREVD